tara:strand:- start:4880 stop:5890 length:1011 start_codon:yes stop_codon:yes gene_type:complete
VQLVRIKGRRKWYVRWTVDRRSRTTSTGTEDKSAAELYLRKFKASFKERKDKIGCVDIIDRYLDARKNANSYERIHFASLPLKEYFKDLPPMELDEEDFRDYAAQRGGSSETTRRELSMLRAALKLAKYDIKVWLPPKVAPRDKFLSQEQAQGLLAEVRSEHVWLFTMIALATGARKTAILRLEWDRVFLDRRIIDFNEPGREITNKRRAICPIGGEIVAALSDAKQTALSDYVIEWRGKPVDSIKTSFRKAAARAQMRWCTPHVLKHTAISWFAEDRYTVDEISDMTETDPATVRRIYRKFNPDYLRDMADSQGRRLSTASKPNVRNSNEYRRKV